MVAGISSLDNTVLDLLTKMTSSSGSSGATNATSDFSSLFSTDDITSSALLGSKNTESKDAVSGTSGGGSGSSDSEEDNPMDLNKDGQVTIDEILTYLSSQQEQLTSGLDSSEDSQTNLLNQLTSAIKGYSSYAQSSSLLSDTMSSMLSVA